MADLVNTRKQGKRHYSVFSRPSSRTDDSYKEPAYYEARQRQARRTTVRLNDTERAKQERKDYKANKLASSLAIKELKAKNKETLLKARITVKAESLISKILKRKGLLGLGTALVGAGMAAKQAYDESENKQ